MEDINQKGQYEFCDVAKRSYDYPCLNCVCGYNRVVYVTLENYLKQEN